MIREELFKRADPGYKQFLMKLVKELEEDDLIGVRKKDLREVYRATKPYHQDFLREDHLYQEEYLLHLYIIAEIKDSKVALGELDRILERLDNWELTDAVKIKNLDREEEIAYAYFEKLFETSKPFYIRTGLVLMMRYFNRPEMLEKNLNLILSITNDNYYVKIGVGWFLSEFTKKYKEEGFSLLESQRLKEDFQNLTIRKIRESRGFSLDEKEMVLKYKK